MTERTDKTHTRESYRPCPFCGGHAERLDFDDGENAGGSCIYCTQCYASEPVEFGFKENFISNWNSRSPNDVAALEARVRELEGVLKAIAENKTADCPGSFDRPYIEKLGWAVEWCRRKARAALSREGGV